MCFCRVVVADNQAPAPAYILRFSSWIGCGSSSSATPTLAGGRPGDEHRRCLVEPDLLVPPLPPRQQGLRWRPAARRPARGHRPPPPVVLRRDQQAGASGGWRSAPGDGPFVPRNSHFPRPW
ncbi:hypothetical protein PVAP13_9KG169026 [Panicum virgatum]|uniref:Uncharacterized protein n=1 Tax=Panicum virgatum TaxID=38727 RepID=A0A8T0NKV3_PANVG|nr:hypothetical protein PVAP13_9KG169026 [Panicum virgatum]